MTVSEKQVGSVRVRWAKVKAGYNLGWVCDWKLGVFIPLNHWACFSYLYCKRKVLPCGVQTTPLRLDITITPNRTKGTSTDSRV